MRDLAEYLIADIREEGDKPFARHVRVELLVEVLATQALALAAFRHGNIEKLSDARRFVEDAAGYPGVTSRALGLNLSGGTIGDAAAKRLCVLAGFHPADRPE